MTHEAQMHSQNCTLTLTYNNDNIPRNGSLDPKDHQRFIKRLRKKHGSLRYFHCGEYGEDSKRPHYHTVLFGLDFLDKYPCGTSRSGLPLYASDSLNNIWGNGFAYIGTLTFQSAQYAAKYTTKIMNVSKASSEQDYERWREQNSRVNPLTGEIVQVEPEYATMSTKPGIGRKWYEKYRDDVYPEDFVVLNNRKFMPPRIYDRWLEEDDPEKYAEIKSARVGNRNLLDGTDERLRDQEKCAIARNNLFGERE